MMCVVQVRVRYVEWANRMGVRVVSDKLTCAMGSAYKFGLEPAHERPPPTTTTRNASSSNLTNHTAAINRHQPQPLSATIILAIHQMMIKDSDNCKRLQAKQATSSAAHGAGRHGVPINTLGLLPCAATSRGGSRHVVA